MTLLHCKIFFIKPSPRRLASITRGISSSQSYRESLSELPLLLNNQVLSFVCADAVGKIIIALTFLLVSLLSRSKAELSSMVNQINSVSAFEALQLDRKSQHLPLLFCQGG